MLPWPFVSPGALSRGEENIFNDVALRGPEVIQAEEVLQLLAEIGHWASIIDVDISRM